MPSYAHVPEQSILQTVDQTDTAMNTTFRIYLVHLVTNPWVLHPSTDCNKLQLHKAHEMYVMLAHLAFNMSVNELQLAFIEAKCTT